MFADYGAVPQTLAKQYTTVDEEESILNRTITGLLLSGGHAKAEHSSFPVQSQILQKYAEHSDESMDSAPVMSREQNQTSSVQPNTTALFAPPEKMYQPAPVNIFKKSRYIMHRYRSNALFFCGGGDS